jgi:hypothetical protein
MRRYAALAIVSAAALLSPQEMECARFGQPKRLAHTSTGAKKAVLSYLFDMWQLIDFIAGLQPPKQASHFLSKLSDTVDKTGFRI